MRLFSNHRGLFRSIVTGLCLLLTTASAASANEDPKAEPSEPATKEISELKSETDSPPEEAADAKTDKAPDVAPELSVPPLNHIEFPENRPDWVDDRPDFEHSDHTIVVLSGPCETAEECAEELEWARDAAINTYITELVDAPGGPEFYLQSAGAITERVIGDEYAGEVIVGGEAKHESAVRLRFDPEIRSEIRAAWRDTQVGHRLKWVAGVTGLGTLFLVCTSGLLGVASRRIERKQRVVS